MQWDAAEAALTRGILFLSSISQAAIDERISDGLRDECASTAFGLQLSRLRLSVQQGNEVRAAAYALQLRDFAVQSRLQGSTKFCLELLGELVDEGHRLLQVCIKNAATFYYVLYCICTYSGS